LPFDLYLPKPIPPGSLTVSPLEPRTVPLGFSADGSWIYGGVISPDLGIMIGEFRVASDGARVEHLDDFRVRQPDGLVPRPGTIGSHTVDPSTGRVASSLISTGDLPSIDVRGPDSAFLFSLGSGTTLGYDWGDRGALYALTADTLLY